jgi:GDP-4-dehydro-6-deoxy-D-mannose reductase
VRVLITGASGFAGGFLASACAAAGDEVVGISRTGAVPAGCGEGRAVDLLDAATVAEAVTESAPELIYHLAALSSVGRSWEAPARTLGDNVTMAVNVLEAVRERASGARVVWASSCEVYGRPQRLPLTEDHPLAPANPYAVSKITGDLLAGVYVEAHGLDLIRARPFNHAGPGQRPIFLLSSLARQAAAAINDGVSKLTILTGNPDTRRDFTDVRDVVRAYQLLGLHGASRPGIYNVGSGRSVSAREQVDLLRDLIAPVEVEHVVDPDRVRPHEVTDLFASHQRLSEATGWQPAIPLRQTMSDTIDWWRRQLVAETAADVVRH